MTNPLFSGAADAGATFQITAPTGMVDGDRILFSCRASVLGTTTPPTGWTKLVAGTRLEVWYSPALTVSSGPWAFTRTGGTGNLRAEWFSWTPGTGNPDPVAGTVGTVAQTAPGVTVPNAGALVAAIFSEGSANTSFTQPAGYTSLGFQQSTFSQCIGVGYKEGQAAGATGNITCTWGASGSNPESVLVYIDGEGGGASTVPTITSLEPPGGPAAGGHPGTIHGTGFVSVQHVRFGPITTGGSAPNNRYAGFEVGEPHPPTGWGGLQSGHVPVADAFALDVHSRAGSRSRKVASWATDGVSPQTGYRSEWMLANTVNKGSTTGWTHLRDIAWTDYYESDWRTGVGGDRPALVSTYPRQTWQNHTIGGPNNSSPFPGWNLQLIGGLYRFGLYVKAPTGGTPQAPTYNVRAPYTDTDTDITDYFGFYTDWKIRILWAPGFAIGDIPFQTSGAPYEGFIEIRRRLYPAEQSYTLLYSAYDVPTANFFTSYVGYDKIGWYGQTGQREVDEIKVHDQDFSNGLTVVEPGTGVAGGLFATNVVTVGPTEITYDSPAHAVGNERVYVVLTTQEENIDSAANQYQYQNPPTLTAVTPDESDEAGGIVATLTGTNFLDPVLGLSAILDVRFDGVSATSVNPTSSTSATCVVPAGTNGVVDVEVETLGGVATLTNGFTYIGASGPYDEATLRRIRFQAAFPGLF